MNKARATELSGKFKTLMEDFCKENGLDMMYKGSSYGNDGSWKPKFELKDLRDIPADSSVEKENFIQAVSRSWEAKAEWYGQRMTLLSGVQATVIEFHPRKSKYPIIVKSDVGGRYKIPIAMFLERRIDAR